MVARTIKVPVITNADIASIVTDKGTLAFNSDTNKLELIDNGLSFSSFPSTAEVVLKAGSTMTGALILNANASAALQAVTLQQLQSAVIGLYKLQGSYNPTITSLYPVAANTTNPVSATVESGMLWVVSVAGTINGIVVNAGDTVVALTASPGQTNANWNIVENNIGYIPLSNVMPSAQIFVGNASNVATPVTPTGVLTITNAGLTGLNNNSIGLTKLAQVATQTFLGRNTAGTGDVESLSVATAKTMLAVSLQNAYSVNPLVTVSAANAPVRLKAFANSVSSEEVLSLSNTGANDVDIFTFAPRTSVFTPGSESGNCALRIKANGSYKTVLNITGISSGASRLIIGDNSTMDFLGIQTPIISHFITGASQLDYQMTKLVTTVGDKIGNFTFISDDTSSVQVTYAKKFVTIEDRTNGSCDGSVTQQVVTAGVLTDFFKLNGLDKSSKILHPSLLTMQQIATVADIGAATTLQIAYTNGSLITTSSAITPPRIKTFGNTLGGEDALYLSNTGANDVNVASLSVGTTVFTPGSETGAVYFNVKANGAWTNGLRLIGLAGGGVNVIFNPVTSFAVNSSTMSLVVSTSSALTTPAFNLNSGSAGSPLAITEIRSTSTNGSEIVSRTSLALNSAAASVSYTMDGISIESSTAGAHSAKRVLQVARLGTLVNGLALSGDTNIASTVFEFQLPDTLRYTTTVTSNATRPGERIKIVANEAIAIGEILKVSGTAFRVAKVNAADLASTIIVGVAATASTGAGQTIEVFNMKVFPVITNSPTSVGDTLSKSAAVNGRVSVTALGVGVFAVALQSGVAGDTILAALKWSEAF